MRITIKRGISAGGVRNISKSVGFRDLMMERWCKVAQFFE